MHAEAPVLDRRCTSKTGNCTPMIRLDISRMKALLFPARRLDPSGGHLGVAFSLTVVGVLGQGLARFAYSVLIGRFLGVQALGNYGLILAVSSILILLWPSASGNAAGKYIALSRGRSDLQDARDVERHVGLGALWGCLALGTVGATLAVLVLGVQPHDAVWVLVLTLAMGGYTAARGIRVGYGQFGASALWDVLTAAIAISLLVLVIATGAEALVVVPLAIGYLVFAAAVWPVRRRPRIDKQRRKEILRFTLWSSLSLVAAGGLLQLSIVLTQQWASAVDLGLYSAAIQLATPAAMLSGALLTAVGPRIVGRFAVGDQSGMQHQLNSLMQLTVGGFLPIFALAIFWSPTLVTLVYGAEFRDAALPLMILFAGVAATSFNAANARLVGTETRGIVQLALINLGALLLGVSIILALGPSLGLVGTAAGFTAGSLVAALIPFVLVWRMDRLTWGLPLARIIFFYAFVTVAILLSGGSTTFTWSTVVSALFVLTWIPLNWSLTRETVRKVRGLRAT